MQWKCHRTDMDVMFSSRPKAEDVIAEMSQHWEYIRATQAMGVRRRGEGEANESNKRECLGGNSEQDKKYINELEAVEG